MNIPIKAYESPGNLLRRQVLNRLSLTLVAFFISVLVPQALLAAQGVPNERIRVEYGKNDIKPRHKIFHMIISSTVALETTQLGKGMSIYLIQKNLGVTRLRAEEIFVKFKDTEEKMKAEKLQNALDILCPEENLHGAAIGIARNVLNDVGGVTSQKHLVLTKLSLNHEEQTALNKWIDDEQEFVSSISFDHTKTTTDDYGESQLNELCMRLEIKKGEQP